MILFAQFLLLFLFSTLFANVSSTNSKPNANVCDFKKCPFNDGLYIESDMSPHEPTCNEDYFLYPGESLAITCKSCDAGDGRPTTKAQWHFNGEQTTFFGNLVPTHFGSKKLPNKHEIVEFKRSDAGLYRCSDASGELQASRQVLYCSKTIAPPIVNCRFKLPSHLDCDWSTGAAGDLCTMYNQANISVSGSHGVRSLILKEPNCNETCAILPITYDHFPIDGVTSQKLDVMLNLHSEISIEILGKNRRGLSAKFNNYHIKLSHIYQPNMPHVDVVYADEEFVEIRVHIKRSVLSYIQKFALKLKSATDGVETQLTTILDDTDPHRKYLRSIFRINQDDFYPDYQLAYKPDSGAYWSDFSSSFSIPDRISYELSCDAQLIWQEQGMKFAYFFTTEHFQGGSNGPIQVVLESFSDMPFCDRTFKYQVKVLRVGGAEVTSYKPSRAFFNVSVSQNTEWPIKVDVKLMGGPKRLFQREISLEKSHFSQHLNPTILIKSGVNYRPTLLWKHRNKTTGAATENGSQKFVRLIYTRCRTRARFCSAQNSIVDVKDNYDVGSHLLPMRVVKVRAGLCDEARCSPGLTPQYVYHTFEEGLNISALDVQINMTTRNILLKWDINSVFNSFIGHYEICVVLGFNMKLCRTIKNPSHQDGGSDDYDRHPPTADAAAAPQHNVANNGVLFGSGTKTAKFACSDIQNQTNVEIIMSIFGMDSAVLLTRRTMSANTHCQNILMFPLVHQQSLVGEPRTNVPVWLAVTLSVLITTLVMILMFLSAVYAKKWCVRKRLSLTDGSDDDKVRHYSGNASSNVSSMVDDYTTTSQSSGASSQLYGAYLSSNSESEKSNRHSYNFSPVPPCLEGSSTMPLRLSRSPIGRHQTTLPSGELGFEPDWMRYDQDRVRAEHSDYGSEPGKFKFHGLVRPYGRSCSNSNVSHTTRYDEGGYAVPESCYMTSYPSSPPIANSPGGNTTGPQRPPNCGPGRLTKSPSENCLLAQLLKTVPDYDCSGYKDNCFTPPNTPRSRTITESRRDFESSASRDEYDDGGVTFSASWADSLNETYGRSANEITGYSARKDVTRVYV